MGRRGSAQTKGTSTAKGLKLVSAETRPMAASMTCWSVPSSATIWSAISSYTHVQLDILFRRQVGLRHQMKLTFWQGLAAASREPGMLPAMVAATPGSPKPAAPRAWTASTGICSWPKRASATARRRARAEALDIDMIADVEVCMCRYRLKEGCK